jgi:hypothetical protein
MKNTFIGGARICNIINNIGPNSPNPTAYFDIFNKQQEYIVPTLVYTIFTDFVTANTFAGVYNTFVDPSGDAIKTRFCNLLAEFIVNIINNNLISTDTIRQIIDLINNNNTLHLHRSLIPLLRNYQNSEDKASIVYCIINNYLCN